jgi:hypothetical protein
MAEKRAGRELIKWVGITLTVLLVVYVAAYFAMVDSRLAFDGRNVWRDHYYEKSLPAWRNRAVWSGRLGALFTPIHQLDRRLRPHVWQVEPTTGPAAPAILTDPSKGAP